MIEMKKDVMEVIDKIQKAWTEAIKKGSEPDSDGIDLTDVMDRNSELMTELDAKWNQGVLRMKEKKGKLW